MTMATSDWSSSYSEGRSSPRRANSSFRSTVAVSPIPNGNEDNDSPTDSGKSSPVLPHNSTMKDETEADRQAEMVRGYQEEIRKLSRQLQQIQMGQSLRDDNDVNELRRKLVMAEEEQAEKTRTFNEETTKLHSQIAKMRSAVERGEATRQKLEYELALSHKAANQEKRSASDRENHLQKTNASLKETISGLKKQVEELENSLNSNKQSSKSEEKKFKQINSEKDKVIFQLQQDIKDQHEEIGRLQKSLQEQSSVCSELHEKCEALEAQRSSQGEAIHKQMKELEFSSEREDRIKRELEQYQERVKTLEESIEAERAAHLETKFNSEIVQLRVRDLEGALEVERSAVEEAKHNMDLQSNQIRELESSCEEERDKVKAEKGKVSELEERLSADRKALQAEVEEKQKVITTMSKQLEVHQKNFEALKGELSQARKRQMQLDTTYGSSMRELEMLLENFQVEKPAEGTKKGQRKDKSKPPSPALVLENLRHTMLDYQSRCSNATAELRRHRQVVESLSSDCEKYKELVMSKDIAMKELEQYLGKTNKELSQTKTEVAEKEAAIASLRVDLQNKTKLSEDENKRIQDIEEENTKLKSVYKSEEESRRGFLHTLYQRMVTGKVYVNSPDASLYRYSWTDMSSMVSEQLASLMSEYSRTTERVDHLEDVLANKEEALRNSQDAHEQTVAKLSSAIKERETSWKKQKAEIEEHYNKIINDLQNRTKKTQNLADKAWEKVQETGHVKETLEQRNTKLLQAVEKYSRQNASMLAACALLAGSLWPAYTRIRALTSQRNFLSDYARSLESLKHMVRSLSDMLTNELDEDTKSDSSPTGFRAFSDGRRPVLVFRSGAIAVIAANRLRYFGSTSAKMFVSAECPGEMGGLSVVFAGGVQRSKTQFRAVVRREVFASSKPCATPGAIAAHAWFTSAQLQDHLTSSLAELQETIERNTGRPRSLDSDDRDTSFSPSSPSSVSSLITAARSSYSKLVSRLQTEFTATQNEEDLWRDGYASYRGDLMFILGQGLHRLLTQIGTATLYASSQQTVAGLQGHILGFTQRLHTAEVERRSLRLELSQAKHEASELMNNQAGSQGEMRRMQEASRGLEDKIQNMKEQMLSMVPVARFESVCEELNNALKREQQAQALLNEQTTQMQEIGARLEMHSTQGEEKDATLGEAVRGLSEAKMELRRQEHALRQMTKQMNQLEADKRSLMDRVSSADKTMTSTAREKEALLSYLNTVERVLEQSKEQLRLSHGAVGALDLALPQLMLPDERLGFDELNLSPELLAIRNVVQAFMEAQEVALDQISSLEGERQQTLSRLATMDEDLASHKAHIKSLKRELAAACRRQMSEDGMSEVLQRKGGNEKCRKTETGEDKEIDSIMRQLEAFPTRDSSSRRLVEDSYRGDFIPLSAHRDSSASFRPSPSSTSGPSDDGRLRASYASPKRRSSSKSYRKQGKQLGQEFSKFLGSNGEY
ncbi:coiled-coil domain-containing protein 171 isoform X2 [Nematostella vectensis]|uniref:coiled-coil domain-containing protein 171 isoform X2 n=1 Tax=Nematostella vectensis TaxID=45351 RepID=UPI002076DAF9|nr:coiled-coil domain-containing protein 171 isoform X2 [Nematostella vectensis]